MTTTRRLNKSMVSKALSKHKNKPSLAAEELGVSLDRLYEFLDTHDKDDKKAKENTEDMKTELDKVLLSIPEHKLTSFQSLLYLIMRNCSELFNTYDEMSSCVQDSYFKAQKQLINQLEEQHKILKAHRKSRKKNR